MNNQETYHNFTYNTKCNIWRISFNNIDTEYCIKNYYSDDYNIISYNNSKNYKGLSINHLHPYLGELSTMYYVWKNNLKSDIVGFDQYRRQWHNIDFNKINNNKIQVYSYWNEDNNIINLYNDLEGFLYSFTLYIKYYYHEYYDKLNYLLFKFPLIRNHINIFICKWEIFDKICNIVFGFLDYIIPNNQWQNKNILEDYIKFNAKFFTNANVSNNATIVTSDNRQLALSFEVLFGTIYNMISESFCYESQCKYYLSYKCNNIEDLNNILKAYKYNIGNGVDIIVIKDDNNIIKNSNIDAYIYNKIYIEKNNEYNGIWVYSMDNNYFKNIFMTDHKEIKLKPNEYIYADNSIELHKGNYEIRNI